MNIVTWPYELRSGHSDDPSQGACAMDAINWLAHGKHGDAPECTCPVIRAFVIPGNDYMPDHTRQKLLQYLPRIAGSRSKEHEAARLGVAVLAALRVFAPAALDAAGLMVQALRLRALPDDVPFAAAAEAASAASRATAEAASAASRAAAEAASAASRAAAEAASDASRAAARAAGAADRTAYAAAVADRTAYAADCAAAGAADRTAYAADCAAAGAADRTAYAADAAATAATYAVAVAVAAAADRAADCAADCADRTAYAATEAARAATTTDNVWDLWFATLDQMLTAGPQGEPWSADIVDTATSLYRKANGVAELVS